MAIVIYGAGGHARVLLELLQRAAISPLAGIIDDNPHLQGTQFDGIPVLGTIDQLPALIPLHHIHRAVIAIGNNAHRERLANHARSLGLHLPVLVHPNAYVSPTATLAEGTVVLPGAIVGAYANIGIGAIVNTRASVDHDCSIGHYVHIAPGVTLAGSVTVGQGTLIGVGATILPNLHVGHDAIVGAGSVVIRNVPSNTTVVGNPARAIRRKDPPSNSADRTA